jgi:hypothetical protein
LKHFSSISAWSVSMAINEPHGEKPPVDRGLGYEPRDASIKGLLQFAFWMAVVLAVTLFAMRGLFDFIKRVEPLGATSSPLVRQGQPELPPSPRLQVHPHQELVDYCAEQQKDVNSYGWVNQEAGIARIPVGRAMDLILAKGLPTRGPNEAPPGAPTVLPPMVAGETDTEGQCGYLTEPQPTAQTESAEAK